MLVKIMPKGRCGLDYVLGTKLKVYDPRQPVVLKGHVAQAKALERASTFSNKFTSLALCYERIISDAEAKRDIASFENMLLPGLENGLDYEAVWVRHTEFPKDAHRKPDTTKTPRTSLHCIIVNTHISNGRRLQPYYDRIDRARVNAWQEVTNIEHEYASPHDPARRRAIRDGKLSIPKGVKELKDTLNEAVIAAIAAEQIQKEEDLLGFFREQGFSIKRRTKHSITLEHVALKKPLRLEGELYEFGGVETAARASWTGKTEPRRAYGVDGARLREDLEKRVGRKREAIARRYADRRAHQPRRTRGAPDAREGRIAQGARGMAEGTGAAPLAIAGGASPSPSGGRKVEEGDMDPHYTHHSRGHVGGMRGGSGAAMDPHNQGDQLGLRRSERERGESTSGAAQPGAGRQTGASDGATGASDGKTRGTDAEGSALTPRRQVDRGPGVCGGTGGPALGVHGQNGRRESSRNFTTEGEITYGATHTLGAGIFQSIGRILTAIGSALDRVGATLGLCERVGKQADSVRSRIEQAAAAQPRKGGRSSTNWRSMLTYQLHSGVERVLVREQPRESELLHPNGPQTVDGFIEQGTVRRTDRAATQESREQGAQVQTVGPQQGQGQGQGRQLPDISLADLMRLAAPLPKTQRPAEPAPQVEVKPEPKTHKPSGPTPGLGA